jgi:hypothetical protein
LAQRFTTLYCYRQSRFVPPTFHRTAAAKPIGAGLREIRRGRDCLGYNLGMCSGLKMDYDVLMVCFDERGVVKSWTEQH